MASITIKNADRLLQRLNNIANTDVYDTMVKATTLVQAQAKLLAPKDTGNLAGSIHQNITKSNDNILGSISTNVRYAPYVEFGTGVKGNGTYPYKPKNINLTYRSSGWCYFDESKQELIFTKGQVAQPYMYPALKRNEKAIKQLFKDGVKAKIDSQCKGGK